MFAVLGNVCFVLCFIERRFSNCIFIYRRMETSLWVMYCEDTKDYLLFSAQIRHFPGETDEKHE
jgi:hypothetical protein